MTTADKNYILSQMANIVNTDANGAITGLNTSTYTSNLGPVGNVTITGGSNGQVLTTNGSGVLNWSTISTNNVANANYAAYAGNITIAAQSNITSVGTLSGLTVSGASNLGAVGNITITGGSNGQVLSTNGSGGLSWANVSGGGGGSGIYSRVLLTSRVTIMTGPPWWTQAFAVTLPSAGTWKITLQVISTTATWGAGITTRWFSTAGSDNSVPRDDISPSLSIQGNPSTTTGIITTTGSETVYWKVQNGSSGFYIEINSFYLYEKIA